MQHISLYEDVLVTGCSHFFFPNFRHDAMMSTEKLHRLIGYNFQDKIAKVAN